MVNTGEVVGASSFSVGHGPSILKKAASLRMLHQVSDVENFGCYPLRKRVRGTAGSFALVIFYSVILEILLWSLLPPCVLILISFPGPT